MRAKLLDCSRPPLRFCQRLYSDKSGTIEAGSARSSFGRAARVPCRPISWGGMRGTFKALFANVRLVQSLFIAVALLYPAAVLFGQEPINQPTQRAFDRLIENSVGAVLFGQEPTNQPVQRAFDRLIENSVGAVLHPEASTTLTTCDVTGILSFGVPASGLLGSSHSCYSAGSGLWSDFWTFSGSAGQRVRLAFTSSPSALATIQDYSTGTVLASSSSCGLARSCSFEYTLLNSSQYVVGFGAYSTGSYTLTLSSVSGTACEVTGTLSFGVPANGLLGSSHSCYDAFSGLWSDFWTFSGSAGQRVRLAFTSSPSALATIQDHSSGTVLASSNACGLAQSCSFEYTLLNSSQYFVGFGAYSTGSYTLTLSSVSGSSPPPAVTLPAAASLHGAPPTFFHSDVSVFNPSATQTATVTARYRCFTGACGNATQTFTVPPRQMRVFDDIVGTLFGAAETGGAVEFSGNVLVDSRLYTPSRPAPTVGMHVPGLSAAEAYAEAVVTSLSFSANLSTGFRTNVGVYNGNDVAQTVTFTLFNPQGVQIGQTAQLVPARTPLQINNIASFVGITTDVPSFYVVVRGNGTSKNYVYAAVLDNQSQDLIFVKGADSRSP